jgi:NADPH2:quinone reductase
MRAAVITEYKQPLEIRTLPDPEPGPGQVRVRVKAIGLNFADVLMRLGVVHRHARDTFRPWPRILGSH